MTRRACCDKHNELRGQPKALDPRTLQIPTKALSPSEIAEVNEKREIVRRIAKAVLTERDFEILFEAMTGLTYEEIAAVQGQGMTANSVGVVLSRAKSRVKRAIFLEEQM